MALNDFLAMLAQALIIIAMPVVIAAAVQFYRVQSQQLQSRLSEDQRGFIDRAIKIAVQAAEQTGLAEQIAGPEKRDMAVKLAQRFFDERGIRMDLASIVAMVESEVLTQFNNPQMPQDTPEARRALLERAVKAAVKAAEESGLTGAIADVAEHKKGYAFQLALKQLADLGISVDPEVLGGLIDAETLESAGVGTQGMTPAVRQSLIDQAVSTGVLAAQQSGEKGLIENSGPVKKSYAMHLAKEFMQNHSIRINDALLSGMIEAELARLSRTTSNA